MVLCSAIVVPALCAGAASAASFPPYFPAYEQDAEVGTSASPTTASVGSFALLSSLVTNHGPYGAVIVFTDTVPGGLSISAVAAGSGTCATSGQTVACRIAINAGESAPVNIVVTPTTAGSFSNRVTVSPGEGQIDPVAGNDSATATLTVAAASAPAPTPSCTVPALKRTPPAPAKKVLSALHCKPGKASYVHSRGVAKGQVIKTTPKPGSYAAGRAVSLLVSSGPAKARGKRGR
jgi:hypothetical protein